LAPSFCARLDQLLHALAMLPRDDRPHVRLGFAVGGADLDRARGLDDGGQDFLEASPIMTAVDPAMQRSPAQP
jgi:hypothetical protein